MNGMSIVGGEKAMAIRPGFGSVENGQNSTKDPNFIQWSDTLSFAEAIDHVKQCEDFFGCTAPQLTAADTRAPSGDGRSLIWVDNILSMIYDLNRIPNLFQEAAMKLKELQDYLNKLPADYEVKVSSYFVSEGESDLKYFAASNEQFIAINDESILGISCKDDIKLVHVIGVQQQAPHFGSGDFSKDSQ